MKKTIAMSLILIAMTATANAQILCAVSAESQPGEYTKVLGTKVLDETAPSQVIFQEGNLTYAAAKNVKNETLTVSIYDVAQKKVYAAAVAKTSEQLIVISPDLKRTLGCFANPNSK
jgi:hypothetical protein